MADDWKEAKSFLGEVDIHEKKQSHNRKVDGLFIVTVNSEKNLSDESYDKIFDSKQISIISDSVSRIRAIEISEKVYEVETQLRKLILHVSDSIPEFFTILNREGSRINNRRTVSSEKSLDPITSELTYEQIIKILDVDLSWSTKENLSAHDLLDLLESAKNLSHLKIGLKKKLRPQFVWDEIAGSVLGKKISWAKVKGDISELKDFRNKSAHHKIITEKEKGKFIEISKRLIPKITPKSNLTTGNVRALKKTEEKIKKVANSGGGYPIAWSSPPLDTIIDSWGMYNRESVSYAAFRVASSGRHMPYWGGQGNANQWPSNARSAGIAVDNIPRVGDVAIGHWGMYGHAMYIEAVLPNGTIKVSQFNHDYTGNYSEANIPATGLSFIHF